MYIGPILQAKAIQLHDNICEARGSAIMNNFSASDGWLWRFCQRYNIRQLSLQGEKLSADQPAADLFISEFRALFNSGSYNLDQIFNSDETGLYYRLLPQKTLAAHFEARAETKGRSKRNELQLTHVPMLVAQ